MDGSDPSRPTKFRYAQRLAAMLGATALLRADAAEAHVLADGESWAAGRLSTPKSVVPLIEELAVLRRGARTDLPASLRAYRRKSTAVEVAVLLTDGLVDRESLLEDDRATALRGAVELRDRETGERMLVEVTTALSERYAAGFERLAEQVRTAATGVGVGYVRALTSVPPVELLFDAARSAELVAL
jgi:hypothetical protein